MAEARKKEQVEKKKKEEGLPASCSWMVQQEMVSLHTATTSTPYPLSTLYNAFYPSHLLGNISRAGCECLFSNFGTKMQIYGANIHICGAKIQMYSAQTQICGAKIQIFDPKFKQINICAIKNLLFCTRGTPNPASLSPIPSIGVSKKLKCIPLQFR